MDEASVGLKRELRLRDLVLAQIIFIVGSTWIGTAGKLGDSALLCWLLASVFFFVPLVVVVVFLSKWQPLEGGLYQWAKLGGGELVGFLVGWNLWVYAIVIMSSLGLELMTMLSYAFGPSGAWLATSRSAIVVATIVLVLVLALAARAGLKLGKWVHNAGGLMRLGVYAMLIGLPLLRFASGAHVEHVAVRVVAPAWTLVNLNILGKMGFGAFSGFEYVAIFAGESKNPSRAIARSVVIAAPAVIVMFILGTMAVTSFVHPGDIDLIAPLPQALAAGALPNGITRWFAPVAAFALAASTISYGSAAFSGIARLPMVAGVGWALARVVHPPAPHAPHARAFDHRRGRRNRGVRPGRVGRGWRAGGVSTHRQRGARALRPHLSRHVRDSDRRATRGRRARSPMGPDPRDVRFPGRRSSSSSPSPSFRSSRSRARRPSRGRSAESSSARTSWASRSSQSSGVVAPRRDVHFRSRRLMASRSATVS